jgi:serine protease Do
MKTRSTFRTALLAVTAAAMAWAPQALADSARAQETTPSQETELRLAVSRVARTLLPSVVHVEVTRQEQASTFTAPDLSQGQSFLDEPENARKFKREITGLASGIVMDEAGHIITNNHVVEGASTISVVLSNGRRYQAKAVGVDPKTDLAVIGIDPATGARPAVFGDSDRIEVGEWVVAIGHPRGLDQTVTQGIISARNRRSVMDPSSYQDFLQTDAAINPGNSGGPLINLKGEVIGINSVIATESGGFEGIGFAIPSNLALSTARSLIAYGRAKRGWIGMGVRDTEPDQPGAPGTENAKGAVVVDVVNAGPADRAGLKAGDVITKADGREVLNAGIFRNIVSTAVVGSDMMLEVSRQGSPKSLVVKVADLDSSMRLLAAVVKSRMGVEARALRQQEKDTYGIEAGVAVSWLDPAGPLAQAGFETGDFVLEVDGQMIRGTHDFASIMAMVQSGEEAILLALDHRTGQSAYVQVKAR